MCNKHEAERISQKRSFHDKIFKETSSENSTTKKRTIVSAHDHAKNSG